MKPRVPGRQGSRAEMQTPQRFPYLFELWARLSPTTVQASLTIATSLTFGPQRGSLQNGKFSPAFIAHSLVTTSQGPPYPLTRSPLFLLSRIIMDKHL